MRKPKIVPRCKSIWQMADFAETYASPKELVSFEADSLSRASLDSSTIGLSIQQWLMSKFRCCPLNHLPPMILQMDQPHHSLGSLYSALPYR